MSDFDWPVVPASLEALREIRDQKQMVAFVWPDEGEFDDRGAWRFNAAHKDNFEPLLVDMQTANVMIKVYEATNNKNKEAFEKQLATNRGMFGRLVEFCWSRVPFRVT